MTARLKLRFTFSFCSKKLPKVCSRERREPFKSFLIVVPGQYFFSSFLCLQLLIMQNSAETHVHCQAKLRAIWIVWLASVHQQVFTYKLWHGLAEKFITGGVRTASSKAKVRKRVRVVSEQQPTFKERSLKMPKCIHKNFTCNYVEFSSHWLTMCNVF